MCAFRTYQFQDSIGEGVQRILVAEEGTVEEDRVGWDL